jgi:nucleoside-diphosphate-sugar epimerase/dTDP-4-dehydrorhamnose 3,5-epimerase-like enzyme
MNQRILLLGGLGYIGSVVYDLLRKKNYNVDIIDNHLYKDLIPPNPFVEIDIRDRKNLEKIVKEYDIVINFASIVGDPACLVDTNLAIDINCIGYKNIAEICNKLKKKVVHVSTCSVYGSEVNKIIKEEEEGFPIDFYAQTKYTQERIIKDICTDNYCILRLGTVYGLSPRMRYDLVINTFAARAIKNGYINVFGGEQQRPFVHIQDVARAILHVIENSLKGVYNVGGSNFSILKLSEIIKEITNCEININENIIDKRSYFVDSSKLLSTGFEFEYGIKDAVEEIINSSSALEMDKEIYSNLKLLEKIKIAETVGKTKLHLIRGGIAIDDRGYLNFANEFKFLGVKRFYQVQNFSISTIRAFHGHLRESKYVYVAKGSAIVAAVEIDNVDNPSRTAKINRFILSDKNPQILFIPPNYANGFRPLESDSRIIFFSTSSLEDSKGDDYRYPADYWGNEIWEVEDR